MSYITVLGITILSPLLFMPSLSPLIFTDLITIPNHIGASNGKKHCIVGSLDYSCIYVHVVYAHPHGLAVCLYIVY